MRKTEKKMNVEEDLSFSVGPSSATFFVRIFKLKKSLWHIFNSKRVKLIVL